MRLFQGGEEREGEDEIADLPELDDKNAIRAFSIMSGTPYQPLIGAVYGSLKIGGERKPG